MLPASSRAGITTATWSPGGADIYAVVRERWTQRELQGIFDVSHRSRKRTAISMTSSQQRVLEPDRVQPEREQPAVLDHEVVLRRLLARVVDEVDLRAGEPRDEPGEVDDAVDLGHLVEDPDALAVAPAGSRPRAGCSGRSPGCG